MSLKVGLSAILAWLCALAPIAQAEPPPAAATSQPSEQSRYARNGSVRLHYQISGAGPLVVMLHGFADYSATWDLLAAALRDGYRVAALDLRGYNLSDKPADAAAYQMASLVEDVRAVIAAEGRTSAFLIGHDWGGAIAWRAAIAAPEMVDGVVAISAPHPAAYARDLDAQPAQRAAAQRLLQLTEVAAAGRLTPQTLAAWVEDPARRAAYEAAFERSSIQAMLNYFRANRPLGAAAPDEASSSLEINLPVMIVHGVEDDFVLMSGHDHTFDYVSADSAMLRVEGAGRFPHHDRSDLVNDAVRSWLDLHRP